MRPTRTPIAAGAVLCALLLAGAQPARAHFLWADAASGPKPSFRLAFGEAAGDRSTAGLLERIRSARAWTADGKPLDLLPADGCLTAAMPEGTKLAGAEQTWGVLDRRAQGRGVFLLRYYAKAARDAAAAAAPMRLPVEVFAERQGAVWIATVRRNGRPAPGAEVWLNRPGAPADHELKADAEGRVRFALEQPGGLQIRAMVPEMKPGKHDGESYDLVRHYSTLTFPAAAAPTDAAALLHAAHELRETWGSDFPGFSARLAMQQDGRSAEGTAAVSASGDVEVKLNDPELQAAAARMLQSIVVHRRGGAPDYKPSFAAPDRHPQGRAILLNDASRSLYRIQDGQIRQVNRTMGGTRFTIDVLQNTLVEGGRYLPAAYTVTYRDEKSGALQRVESFSDRFERLGRYYLPVERRVVRSDENATAAIVLTLTALELNPSAVPAAK